MSLRVLVIDDDAARVTDVIRHLRGRGHDVRTVSDGKALLDEQQDGSIDLVLLTSAAADLSALDAHIETCVQRIRVKETERRRVARAEKLAEQMERVILPIGLALSGETNLDRLMERILVEAKGLCRADGGTVYLRGEDNTLRFAIVMTDSLGISLGGTSGKPVSFPLLRLHDSVSGAPNHRNVATHVALTGQSTSIPDMYEAEGFDFSGTREFDRRNSYRSVSSLTVPLKDHTGFVTGVLQLLNAMDENGAITPFDEYDRVVVESLSSLAAVVLNNHLLIQRQQALSRVENDMLVARRIQDGFLPGVLPATPGWQIDTRFRPARHVGGDFYDVFTLMRGRTLALAIGDVCDKGVGAALFMALTRSLIRAFALHHDLTRHAQVLGEATAPTLKGYLDLATAAALLGAAVNSTNAYILAHHLDLNMFATLFLGMLDLNSGSLVYMNAGHCSPMILDTAGSIRRLEPTGPAVGMFADAEFGIQEERLQLGDTLFAFSDGVTDARNPTGVFFGEARLISALAPAPATARELLDTIETHVRNHIEDAAPFDDLTMLALRRDQLRS